MDKPLFLHKDLCTKPISNEETMLKSKAKPLSNERTGNIHLCSNHKVLILVGPEFDFVWILFVVCVSCLSYCLVFSFHLVVNCW